MFFWPPNKYFGSTGCIRLKPRSKRIFEVYRKLIHPLFCVLVSSVPCVPAHRHWPPDCLQKGWRCIYPGSNTRKSKWQPLDSNPARPRHYLYNHKIPYAIATAARGNSTAETGVELETLHAGCHIGCTAYCLVRSLVRDFRISSYVAGMKYIQNKVRSRDIFHES